MITPSAPAFSSGSASLVQAPTNQALRLSAAAADAAASGQVSLAQVWQELASGARKIVDGYFSELRCFLVLSHSAPPSPAPIEGRRLEIFQAVLGGLRQKNVAMDLKLAPSTIALNARLALESLGVEGKPSRAHPLLMLAARASIESSLVLARCSTLSGPHGDELRVVSAPRPDLALEGLLPIAELAVIRSLVEGCSYQEIARARGTSTRTVANQISAVFRRLRVSGRNELVQQLFVGEAPSSRRYETARETLVPPASAEQGLDARRSA